MKANASRAILVTHISRCSLSSTTICAQGAPPDSPGSGLPRTELVSAGGLTRPTSGLAARSVWVAALALVIELARPMT